MSFKFNFQTDEDELETEQITTDNNNQQEQNAQKQNIDHVPFREVFLQDLLDNLPPAITFTKNEKTDLSRRDVWDVRFQLASESDILEPEQTQVGTNDDDKSPLKAIDSQTDLIPGVYEGGLKTWECSEDLVEVLRNEPSCPFTWGKKSLEIGCGTAIPSCYLFQKLLSTIDQNQNVETCIHLTDFNDQVFSLVTLPNILHVYAAHVSQDQSKVDLETSKDSTTSTLQLSPEFIESFKTFLKQHNISLRFFAGSWSDALSNNKFSTLLPPTGYDLTLTSETIYNVDNLPFLIQLCKECTKNGICLVAFKTVYFGVGGSEYDLTIQLEKQNAKFGQVLQETLGGVGRKVVRIDW